MWPFLIDIRREKAELSDYEKPWGSQFDLWVRERRRPATLATTTWVNAPKKKKLLFIVVLISIRMLAPITATMATMFIARSTLRITYPGPARDLLDRVFLNSFMMIEQPAMIKIQDLPQSRLKCWQMRTWSSRREEYSACWKYRTLEALGKGLV